MGKICPEGNRQEFTCVRVVPEQIGTHWVNWQSTQQRHGSIADAVVWKADRECSHVNMAAVLGSNNLPAAGAFGTTAPPATC
jgi:hypothetical protein